jgi:hypothetical protein
LHCAQSLGFLLLGFWCESGDVLFDKLAELFALETGGEAPKAGRE